MRRSSTDRRNKTPHQAGSVTGEDGDLSDLEPSETGSLGGRSNTTGGSAKKHMTIEEREAAYNEARSRIFMGFEGKEKVKEKDINSSSSSLSAASGSTKNGGSSAGDADSSSSSPATESEWSGPARRERPQHSGYASASSSTRSIRSSAYISNGSGSSRNSRAASPSSFQFPSLYEPTPPSMSLYDPAQHSAPAAPVYHPPYGYPYNQGQPNPPYVPYPAYYPTPYPQYSSPSHHPQNVSDPSTPSTGEPYQPPPPMPYGAPYMWPHPNQPPVQSPPMQPQPIPSQPPSNIPHAMSSPPPGQPPYQPYMPPPPPPPHAYPYPMPGYYPNQPGHPMPPPPPPPVHPSHMPASQLYDPRTPNNGTGNNQANGFRSGMPGNGVPPPNNGRPPPRNGFNGPNNGNGPKPRNGAVQPGRAPWSYGPGIGSGGFVATGPQPNETVVGPRLSNNNNRRQSNMSSSSMNGRSTSGDDISSVASSASSSSRRAQTMSAGSQHPLPARPDWAINLKPHNSRNMSPIPPPRSISGSSVQSNYSSRHSSHSNPPISLQSNDFPPLTTMQPSEKRMPTGAWGNPSSRPIFGQPNNGINSEMGNRFDETGFERPPPKSAELYNPKTPKRTPLNAANAENNRVQSDTDKANGEAVDPAEQVAALSLENEASTAGGSTSTSAPPASSTSVYMISPR
ncbi:hypothetical protein P691DRAFT_809798 [Macrolepiota fuliginosa MF-IS2]|uniref:SUZ domain-containing protein n=1 Tax=Macrolepiota fuliginosa MF-IS2 TaxID=1400762 RepID=A0A9P6C707_9AGAR|nr:hypothetical protein P691DRAFT_809798 [Macrolepiota fuliginosa MF-IS2]